MSKSELEYTLIGQIKCAGLPVPEHGYRWAAELVGKGRGVRARLKMNDLRDWEFDLAWPERKLAVEVDGGIWTQGAHVRGAGYTSGCEKANAAQLYGWRVLRIVPQWIESGEALNLIEKALG